MLNRIKKLREKPEHHRKRWHIGLTVVLTLLVVAGWGVAVSHRIQVALSGEEGPSAPSPFAQFKDDLTANVEQVKEGFYLLKGKE